MKYKIPRFSRSKLMNNVNFTTIVYLFSKVGRRFMTTHLCTFEKAFPTRYTHIKYQSQLLKSHSPPPPPPHHFAPPPPEHTHARGPNSIYPPGAYKSYIPLISGLCISESSNKRAKQHFALPLDSSVRVICFISHASNKPADQPQHTHSLISTFSVVR